jgi:hypothetical protein
MTMRETGDALVIDDRPPFSRFSLGRQMTAQLETLWEALCTRCEESGYTALSNDERVWFNIRSLIDSTENGGLISYFCNSGADTLSDCRAALHRLGAQAVGVPGRCSTRCRGVRVPR